MSATDETPTPPPVPAPSGGPAPWGLWVTLAITVLVLMAVFFAQSLVTAAFVALAWMDDPASDVADLAPEITSNGLVLALAGAVSAPVALAVVWGAAALRAGLRPADYLALRTFPIGPTAAWMMVLGLYQVFVMMLAAAVQPPDSTTAEFMVNTFSSAGIKPLLWVTVILLLPVSEEFIFRGFMFRGLLHSPLGAAGAVFIPAALWGGIHLQYDLFGILSIMGMGVILGFARLATGSTWTPIAMHMTWNGLAVASTELYLMNGG